MNDTAEKLEENIEDTAEVVENDEKFDIEIVDDTPEEDRVPKRKETSEADTDTDNDDEIKNYSEGVQKRISKLKYEFHEERRAKEEAARLREEAVKFAGEFKRELTQRSFLKSRKAFFPMSTARLSHQMMEFLSGSPLASTTTKPCI